MASLLVQQGKSLKILSTRGLKNRRRFRLPINTTPSFAQIFRLSFCSCNSANASEKEVSASNKHNTIFCTNLQTFFLFLQFSKCFRKGGSTLRTFNVHLDFYFLL